MSGPSEVISVIRHQVRPGQEAAYEAWTREVVPIAQRFPGHRGVAVIRPPEGTRIYTVVLHFDSQEHLRRWLESETRQELLTRIEPDLEHPGEIEIRQGLEFWLTPPGQARARPFKQFLITLSVIYPLTVLVPFAFGPILRAAPFLDILPMRAFLVAVAIVGLMTYVIMPPYTRLAAKWLYGDATGRGR